MSVYIPRSEDLQKWPETNLMVCENSLEASVAHEPNSLPEFLQLLVFELLGLHYGDLNISSAKKEIHIRQVTIYLSNVSFGISMRQLASMFNLNRSTIAYTCQTVEDRRDDPRYDHFLIAAEKIASLVTVNNRWEV